MELEEKLNAFEGLNNIKLELSGKPTLDTVFPNVSHALRRFFRSNVRLRTTYALDFWCSERHWQYFSPKIKCVGCVQVDILSKKSSQKRSQHLESYCITNSDKKSNYFILEIESSTANQIGLKKQLTLKCMLLQKTYGIITKASTAIGEYEGYLTFNPVSNKLPRQLYLRLHI